ncbi:cupin domain-containing protein [Caballeronia insecticola]|uniref:Cupin 2 conserved barrel n=1 Tax=Caballeronia insecticola TaxID=758793 RepID=R4X2B2_9BURK|nr:cupin domain-containing protein [Caballeronia insecticola]BAN25517.1 cupin 2 conserved barrel [Caballeronia insecticola]
MSTRNILVLAAAFVFGASHALAHDTAGAEEIVTPVMKQAIPEAAGKNVLMATVFYKPGQASEAHTHPGSIFAYVLEGRVTSQLEGSPAKTYGPGESWYEPPGAHHVVSKNASATKPAKLLVFAIAGDGEPIKQPLPH